MKVAGASLFRQWPGCIQTGLLPLHRIFLVADGHPAFVILEGIRALSARKRPGWIVSSHSPASAMPISVMSAPQTGMAPQTSYTFRRTPIEYNTCSAARSSFAGSSSVPSRHERISGTETATFSADRR